MAEQFTEARIKLAFWEMFHKSGDNWFDYLSSEDECAEGTEGVWQEFRAELLKTADVSGAN